MAGKSSNLPAHLRAIAPRKPLGSRAKVAHALRGLVDDFKNALTRDDVARCEGLRKTYNDLLAHYKEDIKIDSAAELIERVRHLEEQLALQQSGSPIARVNKTDSFGGRPSETAH